MSGTANSGGRNAKPVAVHRRTGTYRKDRHARATNIEPPRGIPDPPRTLTGEGLAEWHRMVDRLAASKTLARTDDAALYEYCQVHALSEQLQQELDGLDSLLITKRSADGTTVEAKAHPLVSTITRVRMTKRLYLVEFGLTPSSRNRVTASPSVEDAAKRAKRERYFGTG